MLKLLFLIFFISPLGQCQDATALCTIPPLAEICATAELIMTVVNMFTSSDSPDDGNEEATDIISNLEEQMQEDHFETMEKLNLIIDMMRNLPAEIKLDDRKKDFKDFLSIIKTNFKRILRFIKRKKLAKLERFLDRSFEPISQNLDMLRNRLFPTADTCLESARDGLFPTLTRSLTYENKVCTGTLSVQETLILTYRKMMKAELKLYFLSKAVYNTTLNRKEYKEEIKDLTSDTNEHLLIYARAVRDSLKATYDVPHESCDPKDKNWIERESFYHLDGLHNPAMFQYSSHLTDTNCRQMLEGDPENWSWVDSQLDCLEDVYDCVPAGDVSVCIAGARVINWLESSIIGRGGFADNSCPSETATEVYVGPAWWGESKTACLCYCRGSILQVYTGAIKTNVEDNYVVTGVRFTRDDWNRIYLQPQAGKLNAYGKVSNFSWVNLPEMNDTTTATITMNQRIIFLEDIRLSPGYVMTGISFSIIERKDGLSGFGITVMGIPYNYKSGKLNLDGDSVEVINDTNDESNELKIKLLFNPMNTAMEFPNEPSSLGYNYVKLSPSEYADDVGASFLPLINAVPVTSENSPLTGIRIFHKGNHEHAGFISFGVHQAHYVEVLDKLIHSCIKRNRKIRKRKHGAESLCVKLII